MQRFNVEEDLLDRSSTLLLLHTDLAITCIANKLQKVAVCFLGFAQHSLINSWFSCTRFSPDLCKKKNL